ncbi:hypothetical protein [Sinorhizobium meliloti]|uniref:Uncharacterized protein n=1 Tax=Rhizobium meliloti TaxID=382 RepID=A0A2J0YWZ2_RHIML|nr:hypothetical protein [Sinorhizobium meliloti]PJR12795.1 hypothetical protein CEJ86_24780 [Sinorhizobium meliloti]
MADHVWTQITIGGELDREGIDALIEALFDDFHGYDQSPDEALLEAVRNSAQFMFQGQCSGDPDITVAVCKARGLTYSFCFDSHAEWDAGGKYWTPGMAMHEEFSCSSAFRPVICLKEIGERLADGSLARHLEDVHIWSGDKHFPALKLREA